MKRKSYPAREHCAERLRLRRREAILVDALAEIKASIDGTSTQSIARIVHGCITELRKEGGIKV